MPTPLNAIQAGIYARLDSELTASIYDHVPQKAAFPYVVIGEDSATLWDAKGKEGWEFVCTIHAWTKGAGRKAIKDIMDGLYDALHHKEPFISVSGYRIVDCRNESIETIQEFGNDGEKDHYYHGIATFRILIEPL